MKAEELWQLSGLTGRYEAWAFDDAPDQLAELVRQGIKTATCSSCDLYEAEGIPIPAPGDLSIILDSRNEAVCIIRTTEVHVTEFQNVTEEHAYKEGEGDRTLAYWRQVHKEFLTHELAKLHRQFDEDTKVICESFEVVYTGDRG